MANQETIEEYLARGGEITTVAPGEPPKPKKRNKKVYVNVHAGHKNRVRYHHYNTKNTIFGCK